MSATVGKYLCLLLAVLALEFACRTEKPVEPKKPEPAVVIKTKHPVLSPGQRAELGFPIDLIGQVELSAGAEAEPFFVTVEIPSENLKGAKGFEKETLAGFSVRTKKSDDLIQAYRSGLRVKGLLIFKSHRGYGSLPDIVTVVRGHNSYDLLKIQGTEAANYGLDTKTIIAWLKEQQKESSFMVTGAGPDWVEAKFTRQPENMKAFAKKVYAFAPDIREHGPQTVEQIAERMRKTNGFFLIWD